MMPRMPLSLDDVALRGKRVLLRIDADVPTRDGVVSDDRRIAASLPTLRRILRSGGRPIVLAHRGDPFASGPVPSLAPVAARLAELLPEEAVVVTAPEATGVRAAEAVVALVAATAPTVLVLESTRAHPGEPEGDLELAREWASMGDLFVNDAVDASRLALASIVGLPQVVMSVPGERLAKEAEVMASLAPGKAPAPITLLLGGALTGERLALLEAAAHRLDVVLVAGALAPAFLAAQGRPCGARPIEPSLVLTARRIASLLETRKVPLVLPVDHLVAPLAAGAEAPDEAGLRLAAEIPEGHVALDVGPQTATLLRQRMDRTRTFVWIGPVGACERKAASNGTRMLALSLAELAPRKHIVAVAAGGALSAAIVAAGAERPLSHVALEGTALLAALAGKELPGVAALREADRARAASSQDSFAGPVPVALLKKLAQGKDGQDPAHAGGNGAGHP